MTSYQRMKSVYDVLLDNISYSQWHLSYSSASSESVKFVENKKYCEIQTIVRFWKRIFKLFYGENWNAHSEKLINAKRITIKQQKNVGPRIMGESIRSTQFTTIEIIQIKAAPKSPN